MSFCSRGKEEQVRRSNLFALDQVKRTRAFIFELRLLLQAVKTQTCQKHNKEKLPYVFSPKKTLTWMLNKHANI